MKILVWLLLIFNLTALGQMKNSSAELDTKITASAEVTEALANFDFKRLSINPNNLTPEDIKNLKLNFLPAVRTLIIVKGERVTRLARISAPIFALHKSNQSETIAFDQPLPTIFTWKETFVTVSSGAIDILTDDEIAALVAHEIGHLYFAEDLTAAREKKDDRLMRIIELKCDLVALTTLSALKIKPTNLISAVEKLIKERERQQAESFQPGSPSLENRRTIAARYLLAVKRSQKKQRF